MVQNFSATLKYIISLFFTLYQLLQSHLGIYTYASYLEPLLFTPKESIRIIAFSPPRTRSKTLFSKLNPRTYTQTNTNPPSPSPWYKVVVGWMETLPGVFDMLQYFETILSLVESL